MWATGARAISLAAAFVVSVLIARLLPQADVGLYFAVVAVVGISAAIGMLGVATPLVALLGDETLSAPRQRSIIRRGFLVAAGGTIVVGVAVFIGFDRIREVFLAGSSDLAWWMVAGLMGIFAARAFSEATLRALADIPGTSVVQTVPAVILACSLTAALIASAHVSLVGVLAFAAIANVTAAVAGAVRIDRRVAREGRSDEVLSSIRFLSIGLPALGTSLLVFVGMQGAVLMVAATSTASETAIFGAASRIAAFGAVPFGIAIAVLPPYLIRYLARGDTEMVQRLMRVSATATGLLATAAGAIFWVAGSNLLGLVFGPEYASGWATLVVLSTAFAVDALLGQPAQLLMLIGHQRAVLYVFLVSTPLALAIMWTLGGSLGVAIGTAIGVGISNLALAYLGWRLVGVRAWATVARADLLYAIQAIGRRR